MGREVRNVVQEALTKTIPKKKCKKAKWLSEEALQIAEEKSIGQQRVRHDLVTEQLQHQGFIKWEQRLEQNKQRVWDKMRPEMQT